MTDTRPVTCQDCGWTGTVGHCEPTAPRYLPERVAAGDVMPAGECPECGASAMLDDHGLHPCTRIITVPNPERATHFGVKSTARALADVMWTVRNTFVYRVQDMDRHGFRVAVYRQSPYPPMLAYCADNGAPPLASLPALVQALLRSPPALRSALPRAVRSASPSAQSPRRLRSAGFPGVDLPDLPYIMNQALDRRGGLGSHT